MVAVQLLVSSASRSMTINGPSIETSGIDLFADYQFEMAGGIAKVGLDLSHTVEYTSRSLSEEGRANLWIL